MLKTIKKIKRYLSKIFCIFYLKGFKDKIFNRKNLTKVLFIFTVGFISRVSINYIYNINVFIDYNNIISFIYYMIMALFTVLVHEFVTYFDIVIIPTFNDLVIYFNIYINKFITYIFTLLNKPIIIPKNFINTRLFKFSFIKFIAKAIVSIYYSSNSWYNVNIKSCNITQEMDYKNRNNVDNAVNNDNRNNSHSIRRVQADQDLRRLVVTNNYNINNNENILKNNSPISSSSRYFTLNSPLNNENNIPNDLKLVRTNNKSLEYQVSETYPAYNNEIIRNLDTSNINYHNSGNWNYFNNTLNSPHTTVKSIIGSDVNPDNISSTRSSIKGANFGLELELRRNKVAYDMKCFNEVDMINENRPSWIEEIEVSNKGVLNNVKVGFKYIDINLNKVEKIYIKYHDIGKRKVYWNLWEKHKDEYTSYAEFKRSLNPDINIWKQIANDAKIKLKDEVQKLLDVKRPFDRPLDSNRVYPIDNIRHKKRS